MILASHVATSPLGACLQALARSFRQAATPVSNRWQAFSDLGFDDAEAGRPAVPPNAPAEARSAYLEGYEESELLNRAW